MKSKEQSVFSHYEKNPSSRFDEAYEFANEVHKQHFRKDGTKYIVHPLEGVYIEHKHGINDVEDHILMLLHDTIEESRDQGGKIVTRKDIEERFGAEMADDVMSLTKERGLDTRGLAAYFEEIRKKPRRIFAKIVDRYINIRRGMFGIFSDEKTGEYAYETRYYILRMSSDIINLSQTAHDFSGKEAYVKYCNATEMIRGAIKGILRGADHTMHLYQDVKQNKKLIEKVKELETEVRTLKDKMQ